MKKTILSAIACTALLFSSCEEWDPVFTLENGNPSRYEDCPCPSQVVKEGDIVVNTTIADSRQCTPTAILSRSRMTS